MREFQYPSPSREAAVREEGQDGRIAVSVRARVRVGSRLLPAPGVVGIDEPHHQLATVVRELEDLVVHTLPPPISASQTWRSGS